MRLGELTHDLLRLASEIATLAERVDAGEPFGSDEREHLLAMLAELGGEAARVGRIVRAES